uniref:Mitochondrial GTPase 1 n=1 Tax=Syphacia muris TaxID=451379 RepID=A0A0N5ARE2_9BILA
MYFRRFLYIATMKFRDHFVPSPNMDYKRWFPMHMSVQMKKMEGKLRSVDLIIEVHDARIPLTGRNVQMFSSLYAVRPHILVMNKMDLIDCKIYKKLVENHYSKLGVQHIVWTDCKRRSREALKMLQKKILEVLQSEPRFNRAVKTEYQIMVIGIPNVGKSSLINSLRISNLGLKAIAAAEGARPGVTVRVQNRVRVLDKPPIYVLDTPGVLSPSGTSMEEVFKLSLCNLIPDSTMCQEHVADYFLYWLNKSGDFSYVDYLNIPEPYDDISTLLLALCKSKDWKYNCVIPGKGKVVRWDFERATKHFIEFYREGYARDCCLDNDQLLFQG